MNKIRFIPMITLTALLTGCSLFGGNGMKAPKFAKEGEEVSYSEFIDKMDDIQDESELFDADSKLTDRTLKITYGMSETASLKRGKKEVRKSTSQQTGKSESQFDASNLTAKEVGETKMTEKMTTQEGNSSSTSSRKQEVHYQFEKVEGNNCLVLANAKTKEYYSYRSVVSGSDEDEVFDSLIKNSLSSYIYLFSSRMPMTEQDAKDYLFYINNDTVFTYSLTKEDTDDDDICERSSTTKIKAQIDMTDKKQSMKLSFESKSETYYRKDANGYKEGDTYVVESKTYYDCSVSAKDLNIKPVNIDDYTLNSGAYYSY